MFEIRFLQAYGSHGIDLWALTTGNEPLDGFIEDFPFNCMAFTPETQRDFVKLDLGPILSAAGYGPDKLKIMIMDDQRLLLPKWADVVLSDANASKYIAGIGFHWYTNVFAPPTLLDLTHDAHPDKFILATEACEGSSPIETQKVILGSWERAENYASDILDDLNHWTSGWVDWNLAVDLLGGPNWVKNYVDSPIIVNASSNEFYKQPMFYALGHFAKFVPPGSVRLDLSTSHANCFLDCPGAISSAAFKTPDNDVVLVILNKNNFPVNVNVKDFTDGQSFTKKLEANSIATFRK